MTAAWQSEFQENNVMKILSRIAILGLFVSFTSLAMGQNNRVNLDELSQAVRENPENTASFVGEAVSLSLGQITAITAITDRLMARFPDLTEEIVFGAIAGMPTPLSEDDLTQLLTHAVLFRPALAPEIVVGARRATTPAMEPVITAAVRNALQRAIGAGGLGVIGRTTAASTPAASYNPTLRIISPSGPPFTPPGPPPFVPPAS